MVVICKTIFFPVNFVPENHKTQILWMVQATFWFLHCLMTSRKKRTEVSSRLRGFPWSLFVTVKWPFMCSANKVLSVLAVGSDSWSCRYKWSEQSLNVWSFTSLKPRKGSTILIELNTKKELKDKSAAELLLSVWTCQPIMILKTQAI